MEHANEVLQKITDRVQQSSSSRKDASEAMRAIINDPTYEASIYSKDGVNIRKPGEEFRTIVSDAIAAVTHIPKSEAAGMLETYNFTTKDAASLVDLSTDFIDAYLRTGRKLPLGGRVDSDISLAWRGIGDKTTAIPTKDGGRVETFIPGHGGIKVSNPCPSWVQEAYKNK